MDAGTSSQSGENSATFNNNGAPVGKTPPATTAGSGTGVTVNETNGTATGTSVNVLAAKGQGGVANDNWSANGKYKLKFQKNDCKYTVEIDVEYKVGGGTNVIVRDG